MREHRVAAAAGALLILVVLLDSSSGALAPKNPYATVDADCDDDLVSLLGVGPVATLLSTTGIFYNTTQNCTLLPSPEPSCNCTTEAVSVNCTGSGCDGYNCTIVEDCSTNCTTFNNCSMLNCTVYNNCSSLNCSDSAVDCSYCANVTACVNCANVTECGNSSCVDTYANCTTLNTTCTCDTAEPQYNCTEVQVPYTVRQPVLVDCSNSYTCPGVTVVSSACSSWYIDVDVCDAAESLGMGDGRVVMLVGVAETLTSPQCTASDPNYTPLADGFLLDDYDECAFTPCHQHAYCTNTPGSFSCTCKQGYIGDGKVACGCNTGNGYFVNETGACLPCEPHCEQCYLDPQVCIECSPGYEVLPYCGDVDECATGAHNCPVGTACVNTNGSFVCDDADECLTDPCNVGYVCTNTPGSFTCTNVNECLNPNVTCPAGYTCWDTTGSYYCSNINECTLGTHTCDDPYPVCVDTSGSYYCTAASCPYTYLYLPSYTYLYMSSGGYDSSWGTCGDTPDLNNPGYTYAISGTGNTITLTTCGQTGNPVVYLRVYDCATGECVTGAVLNCGSCNNGAYVSWASESSKTYVLRISYTTYYTSDYTYIYAYETVPTTTSTWSSSSGTWSSYRNAPTSTAIRYGGGGYIPPLLAGTADTPIAATEDVVDAHNLAPSMASLRDFTPFPAGGGNKVVRKQQRIDPRSPPQPQSVWGDSESGFHGDFVPAKGGGFKHSAASDRVMAERQRRAIAHPSETDSDFEIESVYGYDPYGTECLAGNSWAVEGALLKCSLSDECADGFLCSDGFCQKYDGGAIPSTIAMTNGYHLVLVGFGLYAAIMCACVCLGSAAESFCGTDVEGPTMAGGLICVAVLVPCVVIALSTTHVAPELPSLDLQTANVSCTILNDLSCLSFRCNVAKRQCFAECDTDSACREWAKCEGGECVLNEDGREVIGVRRPLAGWALILIYFGGLFVLGWMCGVCGIILEDEFDYDEDDVYPVVFSCAAFLSVVLVIALAVPSYKVKYSSSDYSTEYPCTDHAQCFPYACVEADGTATAVSYTSTAVVASDRYCLISCDRSIDCHPGYKCGDDDCKPRRSTVETKYYREPKMIGVLLGIGIPAFVMAMMFGAIAADDGDLADTPSEGFAVGVAMFVFFLLVILIPVITAKYAVSVEGSAAVSTAASSVYTATSGSASGTVSETPNGTTVEVSGECAMGKALNCIPFACYVNTGSTATAECSTTCKRDRQCYPGAECRDNLCTDSNLLKYASGDYDVFRSRGSVIAITITLTLLTLWVLMLCCGIASEVFDFESILVPSFSVLGAIIACMIFAAILSAPVRKASLSNAPVNPDSVCGVVRDPRCGDYMCDVEFRKCLVRCADDDGCQDGAQCVFIDEKDLPNSFSSPYDLSKDEKKLGLCAERPVGPALPRAAGFAVAIAASALLAASCFLCSVCATREAGESIAGWMGADNEMRSLQMLAFVFLFISFIGAFAPYLTINYPVKIDHVGDGDQCDALEHIACQPFYCDTSIGRCFEKCEADNECMDGFSCVKGKCETGTGTLLGIAYSLGGAAVVGVVFCCFTYLYLQSEIIAARERAERQRIAAAEAAARAEAERIEREREEERRAIQAVMRAEHEARLRDVNVAVLDVAPNDSSDFTVPGLLRHESEYNPFNSPNGGAANRPFGYGAVTSDEPDLPSYDAITAAPPSYSNILPSIPGSVEVSDYSDSDSSLGPPPPGLPSRPPPPVGHPAHAAMFNRLQSSVDVLGGTRAPDLPPPDYTIDMCCICFSEESQVRMVGRSCRHGFCDECAEASLSAIVNNDSWPARCPGCVAAGQRVNATQEQLDNMLIPAGIVERLARRGVIAVDFARRFIHLQVLKAFAPHEVISCPFCELLLVGPDMDAKRADNFDDEALLRCSCPNCEIEFCVQCSRPWIDHVNMSCEELDRLTDVAYLDGQAMELINATAKPCPSCGMGITHWRQHACHHIMPGTGCPNCGHHFCYECLEPHPCPRRNHGLFCDDRCHCLPCPECQRGRPCPACPGCDNCNT